MIIVDYDPFSFESRVTVVKNDKQEKVVVRSELNELAETLVSLSYKYDEYNIKTRAPYAITSEIRRLIDELDSKNKIIVEGI
jgi:hypothetical protein